MKTKDKVIEILRKQGRLGPGELAIELKVSRQYIHRLLNELEQENRVEKTGIPPQVYYSLQTKHGINQKTIISFEDEKFLDEHFLLINPKGKLLKGFDAMAYWCEKQNLTIEKTIHEYIMTRKKYLSYFNADAIIDGMSKLRSTKGFETIALDAIYYLDFYAIERFGKTGLGMLLHYAKQGQNKTLMKMIVSQVHHRINHLIENQKITAILYVPPSIPRKIQIMDYLRKNLNIDKPEIKIMKLKTDIIVPQKALSKMFERISNARNSFIIKKQAKTEHLLIIDDAVGSGATMNEIAIKIKQLQIAHRITGLAITGSFKGFDVISEI